MSDEPASRDVPFVIAACMEHTAIFDLCFRMEIPDDNLVRLRDEAVGRRLRWDGVEQAIAPPGRGGEDDRAPPSLWRGLEHDEGGEDDEALSHLESGSADRDEGSSWQEKRMAGWTLAIEELRRKRRHGRDPQ